MPKQKEPIELIMAKGKKHLGKKEIEFRKNTEVKPAVDDLKAPKWLTKKQQSQFDEYASKLNDIGIMGETDVDQLARYVVAQELYVKYSKELQKKEVISDPFLTEQYLKNQDKVFKQCHTIATSLGMTISSRCKLVIPHEEEEKKVNKFEKFTVKTG